MKQLRIQHLFNKKYSSCDHCPKKYKFSKFKTQKNTLLIPVCKYAKSTPWVVNSVVFILLSGFIMSSTIMFFLRISRDISPFIRPDDEKSISQNVAQKHHGSRHDKLRKHYDKVFWYSHCETQ